jgi:hypothetical protein
MQEHLAKYGPTICQNKLRLAYLHIDLKCLGIKFVRDPSIKFLPGFWNILPENINERLGSSHSEMSETKFLREITDIIGREPGWQEFVTLGLVVVPIIKKVVQSQLYDFGPQPVEEIT